MAQVDDDARLELHRAAEKAMGRAPANTLMSALPPVGWADVATKRDLDALEQRISLRFDVFNEKFNTFDEKLNTFDEKFNTFEEKLIGVEHKVTGLVDRRISEQTRVLVFAILGAFMTQTAIVLSAIALTR